ncbi:hypothetical protein [Bifidobacterium angulatum]|nr:hypothetical protein [Bifidobacterium angulatum]
MPLPHVGFAGADPYHVVHDAVEAALLGEVDGAQVRVRRRPRLRAKRLG